MAVDCFDTGMKCLIEALGAIEFANDNDINPDFAVQILEAVSDKLNQMPKDERAILQRTVHAMMDECEDKAFGAYLSGFIESFGLT